jgi:hypothetical protein
VNFITYFQPSVIIVEKELWKESNDCQQFPQYQQNEHLKPLSIKKTTMYAIENPVPGFGTGTNVLILFMGSKPHLLIISSPNEFSSQDIIEILVKYQWQ